MVGFALDEKQKSNTRMAWNILLPRERLRLLGIFALLIFGTFLETFSLALVVPVVGILTRPHYLERYPRIRDLLGDPTQTQFVVGVMVTLVVVYIVKTAFLIWSDWMQSGFSVSITTRVGRTLFDRYLRQPYAFHLQRNSSILIRNSQSAAGSLTTGLINPILLILSDSLINIGLLVLLVVLEPRGTLITVIVFGCAAYAFRQFTSRRVRAWGTTLNHHKAMMIQHLQQGFGGVKDVKILGREQDFVEQYSDHLIGNARINRRFFMVQKLPRYGLEVLMIVGLGVLVSTMIMGGSELSSIFPVLALFGATGFRLLPAINRITNNLTTISVSRAMICELHDDLELPDDGLIIRVGSMPFRDEIGVRSARFSYSDESGEVLKGISLSVRRGEAVGLVGPSGSGKSTLVDVVLGLLRLDSGEVAVDGLDISLHLRSWQNNIGYVPQSIFLTDDSLRRNIAFGLPSSEIDEAAVVEAVELAQLSEFVSSLPDRLDTVVGERGVRLSGGQRQRIGIARALYHSPSVLVLDEATSSLDTETEHGVMQAVKALQGDKTVIIVAHRLSTVEYCDRLYRLDAGHIVDEGTFDEVMSRLRN